MADYSNNQGLKNFLTSERILEETNYNNQTNKAIIKQIFDMRNHQTDRRIFYNNKSGLFRFPIIPKQVINDVEVDMGLQESLCKKVFADLMTSFISSEKSFRDEKQTNIARFQFLVNNTFNTALDSYRNQLRTTTHPNIQETDLLFVYKGGTTMKLFFDKYQTIFTNLDSFKEIQKNFSRSDSDYSIFINPKLENFDNIYITVNKISTCCLLFIKQQIINHPDFFVPINTITKNDMLSKLESMNKELNNMKEKPQNSPYCDDIRTIDSFIGIGYLDKHLFNESIDVELNDENIDTTFSKNNFDSLKITDFKTNKQIDIRRNDFFMTYEDGNFEQKILGTLNTDPNIIYLSLNETNEYMGFGGLTAFCLHRLKINFVAYYKTIADKNGNVKYGFLSCPSELVDVSIMKGISNDLEQVYKHVEYEFTNFSYNLGNNGFGNSLEVRFKSYSIYGHISDLCLVLFVQNNKPWDNTKYVKRLNRLLYFLILELINTTSDKTIIDILDLFKKIVRNSIYSTLPMYKDTKKQLIDENLLQYVPQLHNKMSKTVIIKENVGLYKFIDFYLELLLKVNFDDDNEIKNFTVFNENIFKFLKEVNDNIITIKCSNNNFEGNPTIPDGLITLNALGGNDDLYKQKYFKYKSKYLKLKNSL